MLKVNSLSDEQFENVLPYSVDHRFILLFITIKVQKHFSLIQSHLSNFDFIECTVGFYAKIVAHTDVLQGSLVLPLVV